MTEFNPGAPIGAVIAAAVAEDMPDSLVRVACIGAGAILGAMAFSPIKRNFVSRLDDEEQGREWSR